MDIWEICALAVLCAAVGAIIGNMAGGLNVAVKLAGLALALGGVVGILGEVVRAVGELSFGGEFSEYASLMMKGVGIATLCRVCSDVCRDCGQSTVASAVESAGKLTMILLSMPIVADLLQYANELLEKI
ncbi:MAG: hypothetical protein IKJ00_02665 [Clostridia bacterium]|nr:hypothetical protein [Clostridia bacterium]